MKYFFYLLTLLLLLSCVNPQKSLTTLRGEAIGTTYNIKYIDKKQRNFSNKIHTLINLLNQSISTYLPLSNISKINKGDTLVKVDSIFKDVFLKSLKIYTETNGFFDPTVGNLVNAWGFGPKKTKKTDSINVQSMLKFVGFDKVILKKGKIIKKYPQIYLDFNAIGKGYLIDLIGRMFENNKIENYLIEIGGEIRAKGTNNKGKYWKIGIQNPNTNSAKNYTDFMELRNESMATSGNYRKYRISKSGKKYVHTINPKTGNAIESNLLSASVVSKMDCADMDGYATAFMAMGLERTLDFLKKHPELKVFLIYIDKNSEIKIYSTLKNNTISTKL